MKTIDTRELYTRLCKLETLRDAVTEANESLEDARADDTREEQMRDIEDAQEALNDATDEFGDDEQAELTELETLRDDIGERTMRDGETMIPTSDFEDYARELAEELGAIDLDAKGPYTCIDWEKAAEELSQDYSTVSYQGEDYFIRA